MNDKIMAGGNLDDIVTRLSCCHSMLTTLWMTMAERGVNGTWTDALCGCADLLNSINRDFEADINSAEDIQDKGATA